MKGVTILAVEYQGYDDVVRLVRSASLLRGRQDVRVVIVSNTGTAVSRMQLDQLGREARDVTICHNPVNSGYLGGLNYGLAQAMVNSPEWVVCCNADIIFSDPEFAAILAGIDVGEDVLALGPAIIGRNGRNQNPFLVARPTKTRWRLYDVYFSWYPIYVVVSLANALLKALKGGRGRRMNPGFEGRMEIYAPHGACFILNRRFFDSCPRLDDTVPLWTEEVVVAESVRRARGQILYVPELRVTHNESGVARRVYGSISRKSLEAGRQAHRHMTRSYFLNSHME